MTQAAITTHILDLESGEPARGVLVTLRCPEGQTLQATTDADGRISEWQGLLVLTTGTYEIVATDQSPFQFNPSAYTSQFAISASKPAAAVACEVCTALAMYNLAPYCTMSP